MTRCRARLQIEGGKVSGPTHATSRNEDPPRFVTAYGNASPIVKWAGGKQWLAVTVKQLVPEGWNAAYFEPFVGGGSLFFALKPVEATLSDKNEELITMYRAVRDNPKAVIEHLRRYPYDKEFFYKMRSRHPHSASTIAARLIYLNRVCWNGLYRVNQEGRFNTPFGRFNNPRGARNLIDHKVSNRRDDARRQRQFAERMMQGPRLVAELIHLQRRLR